MHHGKPPHATDEIRERIRWCLWSSIEAFFHDGNRPGYLCHHSDRKVHGNWCRLYTGQCDRYERFPEQHDG